MLQAFRVLVVLLAAGFCATSASTQPLGIDSRKLFAKHVSQFKLEFGSPSEYEARHRVFQSNLERVEKHNAKSDKTFTMGVNKFTHLTLDEFSERLGYGKKYVKMPKRDWTKMSGTEVSEGEVVEHLQEHKKQQGQKNHPLVRSTYTHHNAMRSLTVEDELSGLDEYKDWSTLGAVTPVKDQGTCGSSWAFAATGALEGAYFAKYEKLPYGDVPSPDTGFVGLSEQQLMACEQINGGCFVGGAPQYGFMYAADNGGLTSEVDVPYTSGSTPTDVGLCDDFAVEPGTATMPEKPFSLVQPTVLAMMRAVDQRPVAITINAMNDAFQSYNFGTISDATLCPAGDTQHNALLVGWGTDQNMIPYWIVKNSWGTDWGNDGYVYVLRSDDNVCGVLSGGSYPNLVPAEKAPTYKPTAAPSYKVLASSRKELIPVPGKTASTCTPIFSPGGDASRVVFDTLDVVYPAEMDLSKSVSIVHTAVKASGYSCTVSQCLWAFVYADMEDTQRTTVFPMWIIQKDDTTVCAYLQPGFQVNEIIPVTSSILNYYLNGWYLNKNYWKIQFSPTGTKTGYSIDNIYYFIEDRVPTSSPSAVPTEVSTKVPEGFPATGWWVMRSFTDDVCSTDNMNSQASSSFGVCTMDVANAATILYWFIDSIQKTVQNEITWQRVYYDDPECTTKSEEGPDGSPDQPVQTDTWGKCLTSEGTGAYKSYSFELVKTSAPPESPFPGYAQTTYTSTSANCSSADVAAINVYKSKSFCESYENRSVSYECDGTQPYINYYSTKDCTGTANKQSYSQTCFFTVDYGTKQSISCGTGPSSNRSPAIPATTGYLQTVQYADGFCVTPTSNTYLSYGLCLLNQDGTYSIKSLTTTSNSKVTISTTIYTDSACTIKKSGPTAESVSTRVCSLMSENVSTQTFFVQGAAIPKPPIYGGGQLSTYIGSTNQACNSASNLVSRYTAAIGQCINVNSTLSFTLSCSLDGMTATQTYYSGSAVCSTKGATTSIRVIPANTCGATPPELKQGLGTAAATMTSATCVAFPTPEIKGYLVKSLFGDDEKCVSMASGGPSSGIIYSSMGLCAKSNLNDTYWTMTIPETTAISATNVVPISTMRFSASSCSASSIVGIPFRRSLKLNSCVLATQGLYTKITLSGPSLPTPPYDNGLYTERNSLISPETRSGQCSISNVLSYTAYPVETCIQLNSYSSIIISCQSMSQNAVGTAVMTTYTSPTCKAGKKTTSTNIAVHGCNEKIDKDYTFLKTDELLTCTAPIEKGIPTATPTRPVANNVSAPDSINGWITTTHYDSPSCSFAIGFSAETYGLCQTSVFGGSDKATVYYSDKPSAEYRQTVDDTQYYYYMTRTYYSDDKCTTVNSKERLFRTQHDYYKCTQDQTGYWTKTLILRNSAQPIPPTETNPSEALTYSTYNDFSCTAQQLLSTVIIPELTCQQIISDNGTYAYQKAHCVGTAIIQNVSFALYRDEHCTDFIQEQTYPLSKCTKSDGIDFPGPFTMMSCPVKVSEPTPAPIPASAPTNVRGEIQGWISTFRYSTSDECKEATQTSIGDPIMSKVQSYGLCTVSNHSSVDSGEYIYQQTTVQSLVMGTVGGGVNSNGMGTGTRVQKQTSYYDDDLCSIPSNRYKTVVQIHTLASCLQDVAHEGFYYTEYFTSGWLEPAEYPGIEAGYQVTECLSEGCPLDREISSRTVKVGVAGETPACIPTSSSSSISYMCSMDDTFGGGTLLLTYGNNKCTGPSNQTEIDSLDCVMQQTRVGQLFWQSSRCQQMGLNHRQVPLPGAVTGWVSTVFYEDENCLTPMHQKSDSYGLCHLASFKSSEGNDVYQIESLGTLADDQATVPLLTYYYSDNNCFTAMDVPPVSTNIKLNPTCALDKDIGLFVTSGISVGAEFPKTAIDGGFKYSVYDTFGGYQSCEPGDALSQMTFVADNTCVKITTNSSVKFDCQQFDVDQSRGLKFTKTLFDNMDCSGDGTFQTKDTEDTCGVEKQEDGSELYYTAICDVKFPSPTLAPRPIPKIESWMTSTYYSDDQCTQQISEVVFSFGTCAAESSDLWSITKLDMDTFADGQVAYTKFYFLDDACIKPASDTLEDDNGNYYVEQCKMNDEYGAYQIQKIFDDNAEPTTDFTGGFVMTYYASDSCYAEDKQVAIFNLVATCIKEVNDGEVSYAKYTCAKDSKGDAVINHYKYTNDDCSDAPVKDMVQAIQTCKEHVDYPTGAVSYVTTECEAQFNSPTPAPKIDMDISIQGWVSNVVYSDSTCTVPADYVTAYSIGLCIEEGKDQAGVTYYSTTQIKDAFADHVITTKYFYSSPDCTGDQFVPKATSTINQLDMCTKQQYGTLPTTSSRLSFFNGASGDMPPVPFTGGYLRTFYQGDSCKGKDATYMYSAPDSQCIKYYNGTHFISANHICDEATDSVRIDYYDSADCGNTGSDLPSSSETQKTTECSANADGTFFSVQCSAQFPAPTPAPQPDAVINAWIEVDRFGTDDKCSADGVIDSSATSYGLCAPSSFTDNKNNILYSVSVLSGDEDTAVKAGEIGVITYYYFDAACTEEASAPDTTTLPFYNCEKDETDSYAMSYMVMGDKAPQIPYDKGYTITTYDSDSCYSNRQMSYQSTSLGFCITKYDSETEKITGYTVSCSSTGATISTYGDENCSGTPTKTIDKLTECDAFDSSDPYTSYVAVECGTFAPPTAAPTRMAPLEIQGWLTTTFFKGTDCGALNQDEFDAQSYGLCMEVYDGTSDSYVYYVQDLMWDPATPSTATLPAKLFTDIDCSQPLQGKDLTDLTQSYDNIGQCVNTETGTSYKYEIKLGPQVPESGWTGGYFKAIYNSDSCGYDAMATVQVKPNHSCSTKEVDGKTTSYQIECTAQGGTVIYEWEDDSCGSGASNPSNYVLTKQSCVYQDNADQATAYEVSYCLPEFPPSPTSPPAPAPTVATIDGYFVEETFGDDKCSADMIDMREVWSLGLCRREYDPHIALTKYVIEHASSVEDNKVTFSRYYYEDENCAYYRGEVLTRTAEDLGSCVDVGDGTYRMQTFSAGSTPPISPFTSGVTTTDYIKEPCDAGTETHYIYTPVGRCVNVTQAADYYYYYDTVVGSKISVCVDGNAEERTFKTADCRGDDFEKEITVNAMTCAASDVENSIANRYQSVACTDVPAPVEPTPTPPPSENEGSYSSNINLAVTQVITGCSITQYNGAPTEYNTALRLGISESCSTPALKITDEWVVNLKVSAYSGSGLSADERRLDAGALLISYSVIGVSHEPGTSSQTVMTALKNSVVNDDGKVFNGNLQDSALSVGAMGLASAQTNGKITIKIIKAASNNPQPNSSSSAPQGVSSGAAAGIAIAVIVIVIGLVAAYYYYTKNLAGRDRKATELFSGTNAMFASSFDPRRPTAHLGNFGDVHRESGPYGEDYPTLAGSRTNPLRDQIPDPTKFQGRRIGGLASHEDL